jgi:chemotaxis protein CheZ
MMSIESQQEWDELVNVLKDAEEGLAALSVGNGEKEMERTRQSLVSFHTTAAMLGLESLQKAGIELEKFLTGDVSPDSMDSIAALGFAISSVIDRVRSSKNGDGMAEIDLNEILEILKPPEEAELSASGDESPGETANEIASSMDETGFESPVEGASDVDFSNLSELVRNWGGELSLTPNGDSGPQFVITFTGSAASLRNIEDLFHETPSSLASGGLQEEALIENVIAKGKEFMEVFSNGDLIGAQAILLKLADQQGNSSGLYKEIGGLARGLHDSIRGFLHTLDPSLYDIVQDKIPDSGNRLEHIMDMTEKAAITTLDHVEAMQERLSSEMEHIKGLRGLIGGLAAIGDAAGKKLDQAALALDAVEAIIGQHRSDLDTILGAQDYQDLSGQIIQKITQLLKDIEGKLVNLIRTFGVKSETVKPKPSDDLYGPVHGSCENAVHSQDEVDSLLAEFGF